MLSQIYIKNFKAFDKETIELSKHNIIIGENDSGKTTILMALDIFFNMGENDKIDKSLIRNPKETVEIGIWYNDSFCKKTYSPSTFKMSSVTGDFTNLSKIKFIYIPIMNYDPKHLIVQLASAMAINDTESQILSELKKISQNSIDKVIRSIDTDLLVIDADKTIINGKEQFKYESALKFSVTSDGIPIESRGSGFQKNLMYALLIGAEYNNVILAIDEIENSLSVNHCNNFMYNIQQNINQTLVTTHSKEMLKVKGVADIIPIYNGKYKTIRDLISSLDEYDDKIFLLVEGKYDIPWFKKTLEIIGRSNEFILLPSGGCADSEHLKKALEEEGKTCFIIKDGDANFQFSLKKECIELYVPLYFYNKIFQLNADFVPDNKTDFFNSTISESRNENGVKKLLSNHVEEFLDMDNPLIEEVSNLLSKIYKPQK